MWLLGRMKHIPCNLTSVSKHIYFYIYLAINQNIFCENFTVFYFKLVLLLFSKTDLQLETSIRIVALMLQYLLTSPIIMLEIKLHENRSKCRHKNTGGDICFCNERVVLLSVSADFIISLQINTIV